MKKTVISVVLILMFSALVGLTVSAMDNGIKYEIANDEVTITGYNGISKSIDIPDAIEDKSVTKIAPYAFERSDIVSVKLPDTIEDIGEKAFFRCFDLTEINMPGSLKSIGHNAFAYTGLSELI